MIGATQIKTEVLVLMHLSVRTCFLSLTLLVTVFLGGCAGPAPHYVPSIDNVEGFKKIGASIKTGVIGVAPGIEGTTSMQLRAATMVSAVGSNYGDYIAAALKQELELAKLFDPQSDIEISGTLLKNNIDAGGVGTNAGQIHVRFVVKRNQILRFDKVKQISHEWESSFAAAVAIPLAASNYPLMVQKLFAALVSDPDFVKALRNK